MTAAMAAAWYLSWKMEESADPARYGGSSLLLIVLCLCYGVVQGIVVNSSEPTVILPMMIMVVLSLFLFPPYKTGSITLAAALCGALLSYQVKPHEIAVSDSFNICGVYVFALITNMYKTRWRIGAIRAKSRIHTLNERLKKLSGTDALTGLANRLTFGSDYDALFDQSVSEGSCFGIIMLDIDFFKNYNDTYGHTEGDRCLRRTASALAAAADGKGRVYRFGGEEFIVLCDIEEAEDVRMLAERMRSDVEAMKMPHAGQPNEGRLLTISAGGCLACPKAGMKPLSFINLADAALYASKAHGRNRVTML